MIDIKFRALRDDMSDCTFKYGQLTYGVDWNTGKKYPRIHERNGVLHSYSCISGTEGLYTGLKDRNGKEIYGGDIVRCGYGKGVVVFKSGCFMVQWIDDKEATMEFLFSRDGKYARTDDEIFEVIGNIHENPELLK